MKLDDQLEILRKSRQLHRRWYAETYADAIASGMEPAEHYLHEGAARGFNPGKFFDTDFYLANYPDVLASGLNPVVHFELVGSAERRQTRPRKAPGAPEDMLAEEDMAPDWTEGAHPRASALIARGGPRGALAGIDLGPRNRFRLLRALNSADPAPPQALCDQARDLCDMIARLQMEWAPVSDVQTGKATPLPALDGPVVAVIGNAGNSPADMAALTALARAENPQARLVLCGTGPDLLADPAPQGGPQDGPQDGPQAGGAEGGAEEGGGGTMVAEAPAQADILHTQVPVDALALAGRAYTHDAPAGMDALIRGVPLTVTGDPFYAGWGFTDDRAALNGRARALDFAQFMALLQYCVPDALTRDGWSATARKGAPRIGGWLMDWIVSDEFATHYTAGVMRDSFSKDEHFQLGQLFEARKFWRRARAAYVQAASFDPGNARIHFRSGYMAERRKEWREAVAHYRVAIRLLPRSPTYRFRMGFALEKQRFWEEAVHCYAGALMLDNTSQKFRERLPMARTLMNFVRDHRAVSAAYLAELHDGAAVTTTDLSVNGVYTAKCRLHMLEHEGRKKRIFEKLIMPHRAAYALREVIANEELARLNVPTDLHFPALLGVIRAEDGVRAMFFENVELAPEPEPKTATGDGSGDGDDRARAVQATEAMVAPLTALALADCSTMALERLEELDSVSDADEEEAEDLFGEVYRRKLACLMDSPETVQEMARFIIDNAIARKRDETVTDYATELCSLLGLLQPRLAGTFAALSTVPGHGDLKPDNVLRDRDGRLVLIDWQYLALMPAGFDLARFATWSDLDWHGFEAAARLYARNLETRFPVAQVMWSTCLCYLLDALVSRPGWVQESHEVSVRPALAALRRLSGQITLGSSE